ncbi:MAG: hypothetical protein ACEQSE_00910 [Candidatus Aquirickettsiella gammari]
MTPAIGDYQGEALYGYNAPNPSRISAMDVNPYAQNPDDWTTVLTNGISGAVVHGINGMVNNAVMEGQLKNVRTAQGMGMQTQRNPDVLTMLFIGAVLYFLVK